MQRKEWSDRGHTLRIEPGDGRLIHCAGVSRLGSVEVASRELSLWVQVRGSSWVEAREGRFYLRAGEWIGLSRDSAPQVQADRDKRIDQRQAQQVQQIVGREPRHKWQEERQQHQDKRTGAIAKQLR